MNLEMRALEPGRVEVVETPVVDPQAGEVRVRVERCGICGSDLHWFRGHAAVPAMCPGHEIAGRVEAVGKGAIGVTEGDRVAVEPLGRCGRCDACRAGIYHLCPSIEILGMTRPGGLATRVIVPDYALFHLPEGVDTELGALTEPTAVAVHALGLGPAPENSPVLVLGAGTIGILAAAAARHLGAPFVAITARHPHQRALAERIGCDQVLAPEDFAQVGETPVTVIETVGGTAGTIGDGVNVVRHGGTVVMVGLFDDTPQFSPMVALVKEARIVGSMVYSVNERASRAAGRKRADFDVALELLATEGATLRQLITHTFELERVQEAMETAADKSTGAVKVMVAP